MAVLTLDDAVGGARPPEDVSKTGTTMEAVGVHHSMAYATGRPGAATAPSAVALGGAALTTFPGQIPFVNPIPGDETRLFRLVLTSSQISGLFLYDRLWHNGSIVVTTTTAQTVTSVAWPARDRDGSANGEGVQVAIEVSVATTNAAAIANMALSYTNSANVAGRTATIASFPATAVAGTWVIFQLQAGDTGVRSIQSLTIGTSLLTGTVHLVAFRLLATLSVIAANAGDKVDFVTGGAVKLYDNTVPFLFVLPSSTTGLITTGQLIYTQN
jgi:hypothetical protein